MDLKQVILIRDDLKLPKGKLAAQAAHAAVEAVHRSDESTYKAWRSAGMKKVALKVKDLAELYKYEQLAKQADIVTAIISDAGKTVVEPGTVTCCAIGPDSEEKIDKITKNLQLL
ncbi:MAG TPA: peptidyl-tRNA hydrolase Pth2 [Acidobacteriota bacterium]|nr:peptidyl-tRNA hydrolase Pth2 [Acidobacteriota bacterium]